MVGPGGRQNWKITDAEDSILREVLSTMDPQSFHLATLETFSRDNLIESMEIMTGIDRNLRLVWLLGELKH